MYTELPFLVGRAARASPLRRYGYEIKRKFPTTPGGPPHAQPCVPECPDRQPFSWHLASQRETPLYMDMDMLYMDMAGGVSQGAGPGAAPVRGPAGRRLRTSVPLHHIHGGASTRASAFTRTSVSAIRFISAPRYVASLHRRALQRKSLVRARNLWRCPTQRQRQ